MKAISLDFDGVIHSFTSAWTNEYEIHDPPTPGAFEFIRAAHAAGWTVHVLTARCHTAEAESAILAWFNKHGLGLEHLNKLVVSSVKRGAMLYIDDNGHRFDGTWPTLEEIENMRTWNGGPK